MNKTQIEELYQLYNKGTGVSIDSRTVREGNMFFALKGENYDANSFALAALSAGALLAVVDDQECYGVNGIEGVIGRPVIPPAFHLDDVVTLAQDCSGQAEGEHVLVARLHAIALPDQRLAAIDLLEVYRCAIV